MPVIDNSSWSPLANSPRSPRRRYTTDEIDTAIKLAEADGNQEAVAELSRLRELEQSTADTMGFAKATTTEEKRQYNPLYGMSDAEVFARGGALAARNLGRGVTEVLPGIELPPRTEEQNRRDAALMQRPAGIAGNVLGNVAMTAPLAMIPGANTVAGATLIGAGLGALQPTGEEGLNRERMQNTAVGGAGGFLGGAMAKGLSRVLNPAGNAQAQQFVDDGVNLTPGSRLGGAANTLEQRMMSMPFVGDDIANARFANRVEFNKAVINRFLQPLGRQVDDAGYSGLNQAKQIISQKYDDIIDAIKTVKLDAPFVNQMKQLDDMAKSFPKAEYERVSSIFSDKLRNNVNSSNMSMSGENFKKIQSEIRRISSGLMSDADWDKRESGRLLSEMGKAVDNLFARQYPELSGEMAKANFAWAGYLRAVRAASSTAAEDGIFTPKQLTAAIRAMESNKANFGLGRGMMQQYAEDASKVIGNNIPDSGTAGRVAALMAAGYGPQALLGANPAVGLAALGGAKATSSAMYSDPGRRAIGAMLGGYRPEISRFLGDAAGAMAYPTGVMAGSYLTNQ
jgi:hypothetical protein